MAGTLINTRRAADGSLLVEVRGEIDIQASARLRDVLVDAATHQLPTQIMVDLLHVTFIDSTGLSALIGGRSDAHVHGVAYTLRNPSAFVVSQMRKTRLYEILVPDG
jgi:anti-anti-sigma factor